MRATTNLLFPIPRPWANGQFLEHNPNINKPSIPEVSHQVFISYILKLDNLCSLMEEILVLLDGSSFGDCIVVGAISQLAFVQLNYASGCEVTCSFVSDDPRRSQEARVHTRTCASYMLASRGCLVTGL